METMTEKLSQIEQMRHKLITGDVEGVKRQHREGKLTARERVSRLLDPGSFREIDLHSGAYQTGFDIDNQEIPGDAVVVGGGDVNGRPIYVWAQDCSIAGGTMARIHIAKIVRVMEKALIDRVPIVGIYDSEGPRIEDENRKDAHFGLG